MSRANERPAPIRADHSNAFANNTMRVRLPAIINEVEALNPDYPPDIKRRLRRLRNDIANGARIGATELAPAGDAPDWADALRRQREIVGTERPGKAPSGSSPRLTLIAV